MLKEKISRLQESHVIMNRPYLALFIMPLWAAIIKNITCIPDYIIRNLWPDYHIGIFAILGGFLCLSIHRKWFSADFKGNLQTRNTGKGLILLLPTAVFVLLNLVQPGKLKELSFTGILMSLIAGTTPGVFEEVAFRGLAGSNFMRFFHTGKKIRLAAILTGVLFGGVHIMNLIAGAALSSTLLQVAYAIGLGIAFAAVYFRTGTLWPTIILHSLIDISHYLTSASGVLKAESSTPEIILLAAFAVIFTAWGLYLMRDSKVPEINAVWKDVWGSEYLEEEKEQ